MHLRTFRAATMHEALTMVRRELGPGAALLHTREVRSRWLRWLPGPRLIEVTASCDVNVPSRLPQRVRVEKPVEAAAERPPTWSMPTDEILARRLGKTKP